MAGTSASVIGLDLLTLAPDDRQALLCFVCSIHNEMASNCLQHGAEVAKLLTAECPLFIDGRATCLDESQPS